MPPTNPSESSKLEAAAGTQSENDELYQTFSLISAAVGLEGYIKPAINFIKGFFVLIYLLFAFPWSIIAAYFVELFPGSYTWSEVGWRAFAGFGLWLNGLLFYCFLRRQGAEAIKETNEEYGWLEAILCYCLSMGALVITQAFYGRWHEERKPGAGKEAAQEFWRTVLMLLGIDTDSSKTGPTSWAWTFSLFALFISLLGQVIGTATLSDWSVVSGSCDPTFCGSAGVIETMGRCCYIKVEESNYFLLIAEVGGTMIVNYGFLKIVALFFLWAEESIMESEGGGNGSVGDEDEAAKTAKTAENGEVTNEPLGIIGYLGENL